MSKAGMNSEAIRNELLSDPKVKCEYDKLTPRFEVISQIVEERHKQHITQCELAKRSGTYTSNISRFESGNYNPSLDFLERIAHSLGKKIHVRLR